jgi:hypothetical protein
VAPPASRRVSWATGGTWTAAGSMT